MKTQTLESKLLFVQNAIANALGNTEVKTMMAQKWPQAKALRRFFFETLPKIPIMAIS